MAGSKQRDTAREKAVNNAAACRQCVVKVVGEERECPSQLLLINFFMTGVCGGKPKWS